MNEHDIATEALRVLLGFLLVVLPVYTTRLVLNDQLSVAEAAVMVVVAVVGAFIAYHEGRRFRRRMGWEGQ